jgi:hypothetical protein
MNYNDITIFMKFIPKQNAPAGVITYWVCPDIAVRVYLIASCTVYPCVADSPMIYVLDRLHSLGGLKIPTTQTYQVTTTLLLPISYSSSTMGGVKGSRLIELVLL